MRSGWLITNPEKRAIVIRILAKSAFEPATQEQELCWPCRLMGPSRHFACEQQSGRLQVKADIRWQAGPAASVANDPGSDIKHPIDIGQRSVGCLQVLFFCGRRWRGADAMTKPVPDKAEIALEYPEKLYVGTFERSSRFEAHLDATGFALILDRPGDEEARRSIHMHINYGLFASILSELASTVGRIPKDDIVHRDQLARAAAELHRALVPK